MKLDKKQCTIALFSIILIAFFLRIYAIGSESVWLDETISIYYAQNDVIGIFEYGDTHPRLYFLLLSGIVKTIGFNEIMMRLMSVVFGILAVYFIYLLGKKLFNEEIGLISALLLGLSSYNVFYSQEIRNYSLLVLLSTASMYYFVKYLDKEKGKKYMISTILMLHTHFFALFNIVVQNIHYFIFSRKRMKRWVLYQLLIFVFFIPALLMLLDQTGLVAAKHWGLGFKEFFFIEWNFAGGFFLKILFRIVLLYGVYHVARNYKKADKKSISFVLLWLFVPVLLSLIYEVVFVKTFIAKYVIYCSVPYYLLLGFSIEKLNRYLKASVILFFVLFSSIYISDYAVNVDHERWDLVSEHVKVIGDGTIIIEPGHNVLPFAYYYLPECFSSLKIHKCASDNNIYTIWGDMKKESSYVDNADKVIYIKRDLYKSEKETEFFRLLQDKYGLVSKKQFITNENALLGVYVFE